VSGRTGATELDWLLESLADAVDGIRYAVILSPDGLALGRSPAVTEEVAGHLAALSAGVQSLAHGAGRNFDCGEAGQTIVEMEAALLFIIPAGRGTCLALLADAAADAGQIAYEMAVLIKRVGQHMIANSRFPVRDPAAR
jgi:predicted regulator of Ras-like GTPase activity (Roadblock/LC7/MglB family)